MVPGDWVGDKEGDSGVPMTGFTGEAQTAGVIGAIVNEPPSQAAVALQIASTSLGQPSPGVEPRLPIGALTPLPPVTGVAAPMPQQDSGNGPGSFSNAAFQDATANILSANSSTKGGGLDVSA